MKKNIITIDGKEYPCRLTIGVLKKFKANTGKDFQEATDVFSIITLLFMACTAQCEKVKVTFPWNSADVLMDDVELGELESITTQLLGVEATKNPEKKSLQNPTVLPPPLKG